MRTSAFASTGVLVFSLLSAPPAPAERFQLTTGLEVRGYLVGSENGQYLVQIGKFIKRIPESQVRAIVDDSAAAPAAPVAQPAQGGSGGNLAVPTGPLTQLLGGAGGGGGGGLDLSQLMGGLGGGATSNPQVQQLLGSLGGGGGGNLMAVAEKMRDPKFQQQFLQQIEAANSQGANPGAATPYINMLKGLFQQLNNAAPPGGAGK